MTKIKERFEKWKSRKLHQKIGDIFFWVLLVLLILPGPRTTIATGVNKVFMHFRKPSATNIDKAVQLSGADYNWNLKDKNGEFLNTDELKGEVIFLNFWGTYCPPCLAELPEIQGLYNNYKDKVKFVLISAEAPDRVESFLQSREHDLPSYYGGKSMPDAFSVRSIPTTFIISRDGKIISKKVGAADWNSKATHNLLNALLNE